jgi:hypothetical protein
VDADHAELFRRLCVVAAERAEAAHDLTMRGQARGLRLRKLLALVNLLQLAARDLTAVAATMEVVVAAPIELSDGKAAPRQRRPPRSKRRR